MAKFKFVSFLNEMEYCGRKIELEGLEQRKRTMKKKLAQIEFQEERRKEIEDFKLCRRLRKRNKKKKFRKKGFPGPSFVQQNGIN